MKINQENSGTQLSVHIFTIQLSVHMFTIRLSVHMFTIQLPVHTFTIQLSVHIFTIQLSVHIFTILVKHLNKFIAALESFDLSAFSDFIKKYNEHNFK